MKTKGAAHGIVLHHVWSPVAGSPRTGPGGSGVPESSLCRPALMCELSLSSGLPNERHSRPRSPPAFLACPAPREAAALKPLLSPSKSGIVTVQNPGRLATESWSTILTGATVQGRKTGVWTADDNLACNKDRTWILLSSGCDATHGVLLCASNMVPRRGSVTDTSPGFSMPDNLPALPFLQECL